MSSSKIALRQAPDSYRVRHSKISLALSAPLELNAKTHCYRKPGSALLRSYQPDAKFRTLRLPRVHFLTNRTVNKMEVLSQIATKITNSRGVPGTMSCIAHNVHDGRPVLLCTHHVIFGGDAPKGSAVSLSETVDGRHVFHPIGRSLYGKVGIVRFKNKDYYMDCAVASCERRDLLRGQTPMAGSSFLTTSFGVSEAKTGSRVTKTGVATGTTTGIIADINYSEPSNGQTQLTPRQIFITPTKDYPAFASEGDSGALIIDDSNQVVGLLWGTNCRGEGVACHIAPVLFAMNIKLNAAPAFYFS